MLHSREHCLIGKIKGLAEQSKHIRKCINKEEDCFKKNHLAYMKKLVGEEARYHLLARAYIREVAYRRVERSCFYDKLPAYCTHLRPDAFRLATIVAGINSKYSYDSAPKLEEKIKAWLAVPAEVAK